MNRYKVVSKLLGYVASFSFVGLLTLALYVFLFVDWHWYIYDRPYLLVFPFLFVLSLKVVLFIRRKIRSLDF